MYSSGLPILYPISCFFYFILFWVYKFLLLKFYQKTSKFNEYLAIRSIRYIKYGVFFHMAVGSVMYTNSEIISSQDKLDQIQDYIDMTGWSYAMERLDATHSQIYFAMLLTFIAAYVLKRILF